MTVGGRGPPTALMAALSLAFLLLLLLPTLSPYYGFYSDELYYLACADRPALGYVDHPPFFVYVLWLHRALVGDSLLALRLLPALLGVLTALLTGWMARRLGGGRFAQALAMLAVIASPQCQVLFSFFSVNCLELLLWATTCAVLLELLRSRRSPLWVVLGGVLGISLLTKHTTLLLVADLAVAVLLSPLRRDLRSPWPWLGALVAVAIVSPNVHWQAAHGWPSIAFYRGIAASNGATSAVAQLGRQLVAQNPATLPIWGSSLCFFLGPGRGRRSRPLGWLFLGMLLIALAGGQSRADRIAGIFPVAFAGGAVFLESVGTSARGRLVRAAIAYVLPAVLVATGLMAATLMLPILPPELLAKHPLYDPEAGSGWRVEVGTNRIPYHLANRTHWKAFVATVARVVEALEPAQREDAILLTDYFGHAGALEYYGREQGLPPVYSSMTGYFLWGPPGHSPQTVIAIGIDEDFLRAHFESVSVATLFRCDYCPPVVDDLPILVARFPKEPFSELWPEIGRLESRRERMLRLQESHERFPLKEDGGSGGRARTGTSREDRGRELPSRAPGRGFPDLGSQWDRSSGGPARNTATRTPRLSSSAMRAAASGSTAGCTRA